MERQEDFFGAQAPSLIDDAMLEYLTDNSGLTSGNPSEIKKVEEPEKEEKAEEKEEIKIELTEDEILGIEPEKKPKVKQKEEVEENEIESEIEDNSEVSINFQSLTNSLVSLGIISELEEGEKIKTHEDLAAKFQKDASSRSNQQIVNFLTERHGEKGLEAFQAIYINGMAPEDYFGRQIQIDSFKDLDLTTEYNQEKVLMEYFRRQGFNDEKATKKVEKIKNYGDLEEESKDAHENLVLQEEEAFREELTKKEETKKNLEAQRTEYLNNLNSILSEKVKSKDFDGIPVTEKTAKETIDYLYTEKWKLPSGEKLTDFDKDILELKNPKNHSLKVKLALLLKNGLDLSKIKINSLVTTKTEKLFQDLVVKDKTQKRNSSVSSNSFFDNL